ncbi:tryptophan-rich sensory protein [Cytophagaceae bacterium ABcell3]|nr:tryptophan-rich sensory protein [Cytophagaceae bacterium ABcell3]
MSKNLIFLVTSSASFALVLAANYLSNTDIIGEKSVGEVSQMYPTLITPAGYAFSIWGIIYLFQAAFVAFLWYEWLKKGRDSTLKKSWGWFTLANLANALWVILWVNDFPGLSVILMLLLLFSLLSIVVKLNMEKWDAPLSTLAFVWWPFSIYTGWIILATVVNVSAFLVSIGWEGGMLSPSIWAIVLIAISTIIYVLFIYYRNMREAALVGAWGLVAIAVRQQSSAVSASALTCAAILFLYAAYQGYLNRETSPFKKFLRKEF